METPLTVVCDTPGHGITTELTLHVVPEVPVDTLTLPPGQHFCGTQGITVSEL